MYDPKHEAQYKKARRAARQAQRRDGGVAPDTGDWQGGVGSAGAGAGGLDYPSLDHALHAFAGSHVRVLYGLDGVSWYKLALRAAPWPKHYLIVSVASEVPIAAGLVKLDDKVAAFLAGHVKPSPD